MEPLTPIYEIAEEFSENTSRSLFLTGKAGTGKTTFLRNLRRHTQKQIAVVAPTGVAAINAGGVSARRIRTPPASISMPTLLAPPTKSARNGTDCLNICW